MRLGTILFAVLTLSALGLAACSGDGEPEEPESPLGLDHRFSVRAGPGESSTETWDPMEAGTYEVRCTSIPR